MRILVAGYFGYQNAGDEAILAETLYSIHTIDEKIDISIVGGDADYIEAVYGVTGILWKDSDAIIEAILAADMCILGGGGLIQDYWGFDLDELMTPSHEGLSAYLSIPLLSHLLGKPCMLHAVGVGPLQTATARRIVAEILSLCDVISVRDEYSHRLLSDIFTETKLQKNIEITADPAFNVKVGSGKLDFEELEGIDFSDENLLGVNLRHWDRSRAQYDWEKDVAKALDRYLLEEDRQCIFLPFQIWNHDHQTNDLLVLERVRDYMERRDQVRLISRVFSPETLCSLIGKCSGFLGMRYHSILFALKEQIPVLGLAYDPKVAELLSSAGKQLSIVEPDRWDVESILAGLNDLPGRKVQTDVQPEFHKTVNKGIKKNTLLLERFLTSQDQGKPRIDQRVLGILIAKQKRIPTLLEKIAAKDKEIRDGLSVIMDLRRETVEFREKAADPSKSVEMLNRDIEELKVKNAEDVLVKQTLKRELHQERSLREQAEKMHLTVADWYAQEKRVWSAMRSTLGFKLLSNTWRLGKMILPDGSKRRRGYFILRKWFSRMIRPWEPRANSFWRGATTTVSSDDSRPESEGLSIALKRLQGQQATEDNSKIVIIQSTTPWSRFDGQRSAQFANEFASRDNTVLYSYWRWKKDRQLPSFPLDHNMLHLPLEEFLESQELILKENSEREGLLIFEYPFPGFFSVLASSGGKGWITIYDIVDDWQDFHRAGQAPWFDHDFEKYMVNSVDLVVVTNQQLAEKARELGAEEVLMVPNGYRPGVNEVRNQVQLSRGDVTLGYFGHLASAWFDWDLVRDVAKVKPDWVFHLIGEVDQAGVPMLPENIIYHPRMPQQGLAAYAQNWDIGIIPFKDIPLARAADPIKAYEYTAMRLP
ncbi:MAG: polysaccharide pyruvyl transferase family protein, partial [Anaerolineales bacterium]|nr:polysaccharide pyruvyl transferase family protein [Anaerolineales bacterium]